MNTFNASFNDKAHRDQFVASLVHEVRNPLSNIGLSVDMLLLMMEDGQATPYLNIIKRNATRINALITQLLTDEDNNERDTKDYPINKLLDEVIEQLTDKVKLNSITVEKQYASIDYIIRLNVPRMKIAITNIIVNAIEAMAGVNGILTLVTKMVYGKYIIEVKDNGCGISKSNLDKMFKVAFTSKPGGLGIGLTIIYDILKLNQVAINIESAEGEGTTFSLLFDKSSRMAANYTN